MTYFQVINLRGVLMRPSVSSGGQLRDTSENLDDRHVRCGRKRKMIEVYQKMIDVLQSVSLGSDSRGEGGTTAARGDCVRSNFK